MCVCIYLCSFIYIYISRDKSDHRLAKVGYFMHQFVSHSRTRDFSSSRDSKIIRQNCNVWYCCAQVRILQNHRLRRNKSKRCDFGELVCSTKTATFGIVALKIATHHKPTTNSFVANLLTVWAYICVFVCVCVRGCACVCVHVYTHTHTNTHDNRETIRTTSCSASLCKCICLCICIHTNTHTHTHTHTWQPRDKSDHISWCVCI